ncbi:hypothetical protein CsSME_00039182 [Camellia sinensis var. sinensis]
MALFGLRHVEKCLDVVATLQAKKGTGEKASIPEHASRILIQYVYGWEQMSCWSTHVKRYPTCNLKMLAFTHGHEILSASNFKMQATDLLQKNLENARASLEVLVTDLQFLRDQVTITQV